MANFTQWLEKLDSKQAQKITTLPDFIKSNKEKWSETNETQNDYLKLIDESQPDQETKKKLVEELNEAWELWQSEKSIESPANTPHPLAAWTE
ncbi:MAG: hypothetical protein R3E95_10340 [Thiolinea sp.]